MFQNFTTPAGLSHTGIYKINGLLNKFFLCSAQLYMCPLTKKEFFLRGGGHHVVGKSISPFTWFFTCIGGVPNLIQLDGLQMSITDSPRAVHIKRAEIESSHHHHDWWLRPMMVMMEFLQVPNQHTVSSSSDTTHHNISIYTSRWENDDDCLYANASSLYIYLLLRDGSKRGWKWFGVI